MGWSLTLGELKSDPDCYLWYRRKAWGEPHPYERDLLSMPLAACEVWDTLELSWRVTGTAE